MADTAACAPWLGKFRTYAGWVPNVRSHLSFSMIGAAGSAQTWTDAFSSSPARSIIAHQRRVINDYPYPAWLARKVHPDIALNWVLDAQTEATDIPVTRQGKLVAERDRQGMLRGQVRLLPFIEDKHEQERQKAALEILRVRMRSWADEKPERNAPQFDQTLREFHASLRDEVLASGPVITIQFALMRTGECRVWYEAEPSGLEPQHLDRIAEQAYYFIKDVVHTHSHHDATSDQITPLYRFGQRADEPGHDDEVAWRRETLWSLSREIERLNREGDLTDQRRALGIIAFAEAFQNSLMGHVRTLDRVDRQLLMTKEREHPFRVSTSVHDYDFKHLKDSTKAGIDVSATRLALRVQVAVTALTVFISGTALTSSLISTHNSSVATQEGAQRYGIGFLECAIPFLSAFPLLAPLALAALAVIFITNYLFDGRAGTLTSAQRVISQVIRAASVSLARSVRGQYGLTLAGHMLAILLSFAAMAACMVMMAAGLQ